MTYQQQVVDAYYDMIKRVMAAEYDTYIISLMFNQLPGGESSRANAMQAETERTYSRLLTRIIKNPAKMPIDCMPLMLACADWPVPKHNKKTLVDVTINDGRHIQGIFCVPPVTRMKVPLPDIVRDQQAAFAGQKEPLAALHLEPITKTPEKAFGYVMKSIKRCRQFHGEIIVLPKTRSEMSKP